MNSTLTIALSLTICAAGGMPCFANEGSVGNGGNTYVSQMDEARRLALQAMTSIASIPGLHVDENKVYAEHRANWMTALDKLTLSISSRALHDESGDRAIKAALADPNQSRVTLSQPYWDERPVSFVQSFVLIVHEAGHLAKVPLTHTQLDNLGLKLAKASLLDRFGRAGLAKGAQDRPDLNYYERLKTFFDDSPEAFSLPEMREFDYDHFWPTDGSSVAGTWKYHQCDAYRADNSILSQIDFSFRTASSPDRGPLFPEKGREEFIIPIFRETGGSTWRDTPNTHVLEVSARELTSIGPVDMGLRYKDFRNVKLSFRKNGDLMSFKIEEIKAVDNASAIYGYCWKRLP